MDELLAALIHEMLGGDDQEVGHEVFRSREAAPVDLTVETVWRTGNRVGCKVRVDGETHELEITIEDLGKE